MLLREQERLLKRLDRATCVAGIPASGDKSFQHGTLLSDQLFDLAHLPLRSGYDHLVHFVTPRHRIFPRCIETHAALTRREPGVDLW